ncbi:hypothetical protein WDZ92_27465, partial [Nostoc sp. NIES-2111]
YLYRQVDYIKDKKLKTIYLDEGIKITGYFPVELLINQANKYFQSAQLESRPIVQFQDLFKGVEFTPQQRLEAIAAKYEFDQIFNAAVRMDIKRETEQGPSAVIQTTQGTQIEVTNLTRYGHPGIWKAQTINLKLETIDSDPTKERPHRLLAVAQINNELTDDGKPAYRKLGTVSQQSVADYNLKPGMTTNNALLVELKPELSRSQTKLMFDQANQYAQSLRESIPLEQRLSAAAAAWSVGAARQDELERKEQDKQPNKEVLQKNPNFVFAAFGSEIVSRLNQLQFTQLKLITLSNEANNFRGREWNQDEKYPIEIRASHHPPLHERHGSRLVFVQDSDGQYKEYAMLEPRTGQLPIGTQAMANIIPGETYTANATIEDVNVTVREISKFAYAGQSFNSESVKLEIGTKSVPDQTVKIKLEGKTLGELDADSVKQLQVFNLVKDAQPLNLKLKTISDNEKFGLILAESPNGNLLRINNIGQYDYKGQTFNDEQYRKLTLAVSQTQVKDAVFLNSQPLGVLFFKKDKEALKEIGVLQEGKLTSVQATLQSNYSTTVLKVDPHSIKYPEAWTKESHQERTQQPQQVQQMEVIAQILAKIKERPTILFASREDRELGITRMAVDNHKFETVSQWLRQNNVSFTKLAPEEVPKETKKGLSVFRLVNSSLSSPIFRAMTSKFGAVESLEQYQAKVRSLPNRPQSLQPLGVKSEVATTQATNVEITDDGRNAIAQQPVKEIAIPAPYNPSQKPLPPASSSHPTQEVQPSVTIEDLRNWYDNAHNLGKPDEYKNRIVEIGHAFKAGTPLSDKAYTAMQKDKQNLEQIIRLTEISQRLGMVWGHPTENNLTVVSGNTYDLAYNCDRKDLAIAQKDGEVLLRVETGKITVNKIT